MFPVADFLKDPILLDLLFELPHRSFEGFPFTNFYFRQCNQLLSIYYMVIWKNNIPFQRRYVNRYLEICKKMQGQVRFAWKKTEGKADQSLADQTIVSKKRDWSAFSGYLIIGESGPVPRISFLRNIQIAAHNGV